MKTIYRFLIGGAVATAACGADSSRLAEPVPPPDGAIAGSWGVDPTLVLAGTQFLMSLRDSAGVVTGVGSFAGEAGPQGSLELSGVVQNDSVHLRVIYLFDSQLGQAPPDTGSLAGELIAADTLSAAIVNSGSTWRVRLVRLRTSDPPG